jgi:hypothetical protein
MTELSSPELESPNVDLAAQGMRHYVIERTVRARDVLARTIGTREHAALVEAVKQNFPEIYEETAKNAGATEQFL